MLAGMYMLASAAGAAEPPVRQILLLQSFNRGILVVDHFTGDLRVELDQRSAGNPPNVVQVVVGPTGFVGASEQAVVDFIRSTYADRPPPDLMISIAGPAAVFARKYRAQLFPDTPLLFAAVDRRFLLGATLGENEAAVPVDNNYPGLVDDILQVLPETRQVFMVLGSGMLNKFWRPQLENEFRRFQDRVTFVWSGDLSFSEILRRCADLPTHSAIIYLSFGTDASGTAFADDRVLAEIHARSNAPLFATTKPTLRARNRRWPPDVHQRSRQQHGKCGHSYPERRAREQRQRPAAIARSGDIRRSRVATLAHRREPAAGGK